jgi:ubiquinone/menaquinone biosynthesis C-methylase UbiE
MDYDKTNIPEVYDRGRTYAPAVTEQWMNVIAGHVDPAGVHDILDLACGTGRFSQALAARFNAHVIGIDMSRKMLRQAMNKPGDSRVLYAGGAAEAVPLPTHSVDLVFISMAFHHFTDPHIAAEECRRVLRSHGRLCLRTATRENISNYAYVPFFPASRPLLEQRLPSLSFHREVFESASFKTAAVEVVTQEIAADYSEYADKLALKADSILASLNDTDFDAGMNAIRSAAADRGHQAITEPIDLLVFEL